MPLRSARMRTASGEFHLLIQHDELEQVAAGLAAEAEKQLALGIDVEGGSFFLMERAETLEAGAGRFQRDVFGNDTSDVYRTTDGLDKIASQCSRQAAPFRRRSDRTIILDRPAGMNSGNCYACIFFSWAIRFRSFFRAANVLRFRLTLGFS